MKSKVSIIIPVYNGEKYIEQTVKSALLQDYDDIEIIISDDNSSDNSYEIISKLAEDNEQIIVLRNTKNEGLMRNNNIAVRQAKGEYILILGQDDLLPYNHITNMLPYFRKNVVAVFCDYIIIDEKNNEIDKRQHCKHGALLPRDFIKKNPVPSCGLIICKEYYLQEKGFTETEDHPNYGEYDLWVRLYNLGDFEYCPDSIGLYRRHSSNLTNSFTDYRIKFKLSQYLNESRLLLLKNCRMSLFDKIYLVMYTILKRMRSVSFFIASKLIKEKK